MNNQIGILLTGLRRKRIQLGMTQSELARKCGMTQGNISRMEAGKHVPSLETLSAIAEALSLRITLTDESVTVYHVMYIDEPAADVTLSADRKQITFRKWKPDGLQQPFSGNKLDLERFYRFIKSRCYEDGRGDLAEILKKAHLSDNNPYDWIRISHGVTYDDFFWIRINDEQLTWEDVRIR